MSLVFPKLKKTGRTTGKRKVWGQENCPIYTLDWSENDALLDTMGRSTGEDFALAEIEFPKKIKELSGKFTFALPDVYVKKIEEQETYANQFWKRHFGVDTMISDMLNSPVYAFVENFFKLMLDCVWHMPANVHMPKKQCLGALESLLYRFWVYQTGRGLVIGNAQLDGTADENDHVFPRIAQEAKDHINAIDKVITEYTPDLLN